MKFVAAFILLFIALTARSQTYTVTGNIVNENNKPLTTAQVRLGSKDTIRYSGTVAEHGDFMIKDVAPGLYRVTITAPGYEDYIDSIDLSNATGLVTAKDGGIGSIGRIMLLPAVHMLDEVKIVEKVMAMVQKDDTMEFNSAAFKVNPDADGTDLVRKMPTIDINNQQITAQGENVVKILVDGKPFFGTDPWAALKNLPADMIDKVQVYNEKSDQEQFTGFSEGSTSKTINIITHANKRNGAFGKVYAGGGGAVNMAAAGGYDVRYGTGLSVNSFGGDRRITVTAQANNVNVQNFTDNSAPAGSGSGAGTAITQAAGINYSDKAGKHLDLSGSYFFNHTNNSVENELRKTYLIAADSGQIYTETSPTGSIGASHRFNLRVNYRIDSMNSILFTPAATLNMTTGSTSRLGATNEGAMPVNFTSNGNSSAATSGTAGSGLLFRHRFQKKGRTFSANAYGALADNNGITYHTDTSRYYTGASPGDTLNQRFNQATANASATINATYTEPLGKDGLLKMQYNFALRPARADKNAYSYDPLTDRYTISDSAYSNTFHNGATTHLAGLSYMLHPSKATELSVGVDYQYAHLTSVQVLPTAFNLGQTFQNLLPVASIGYKISKNRNLHLNYTTGTQPPSLLQLQQVINNTDPLHLYTGNPSLRQSFRHELVVRYNASAPKGNHSFSASARGSIVQHNVASNSVIALADSLLPQNVILHAGSQLSYPRNVEGYKSVSAYLGYDLPLGFMKCKLNTNINAGYTRTPTLINGDLNYQDNKTGNLTVAVNSNYSEYVDFSISSNISIAANTNSINTRLNNTYTSNNTRASINLLSHHGLVFSTTVSYHVNAGLGPGFDQDYVLCNASIGQKILKKHAGDIRLTVYDIFNENNNIQHTVTDVYIQDSRSNTLQRYFLLVFTYKLNQFRGAKDAVKEQ